MRLQLRLLQACLRVVPSALRQIRGLAEALERLLLSSICSATGPSPAGHEAGCCYALLPAAMGGTPASSLGKPGVMVSTPGPRAPAWV